MVYRITLVYLDTTSGLSWSITNYVSAGNSANAFALADDWNTAYMGVVHANCNPVVAIVSGQVIGQPTFEFPTSAFTTKFGAGGGVQVADGLAIMMQGVGLIGNGGISNWFLHGLFPTYILAPDGVDPTNALIIALNAASLVYFTTYRPLPNTTALPTIDPPQPMLAVAAAPTLHLRRLGRPFIKNGQTHRYRT